MNLLKIISVGFFVHLLFTPVFSQSPVFFHLSTAEGLSDNNVSSACMDKNGILWIATTEGLNSFDGNRIQTYNSYQYPAMADNNIDDIIVDKSNNLWLKSKNGKITLLDRKRNFQQLLIGDSLNNKPVSDLFYTSIGMIAIKDNQQYICTNANSLKFIKLDFPFKDILPSIRFTTNFTDEKIIFYGENRLVIIDYSSMKLLLDLPLKNIMGAAAINNDELIAYTIDGSTFYRISISNNKINKEYTKLLDQFKKPIEGNLRNIARIDSNRFAITSRFSGLYLLDISKEKLSHYTHDPLDQRSIGGNNTSRINYDNSGHLLVTTQTSGVHYYNVKQQQIPFKSYFKNEKGEVFDGFIQTIATSNDSIVWLGAQDRLIRWDRINDKSNFIPCFLPDGKNISNEETIRAIQFDQNNNLWVGTSRYGVLILDKQFKTIAQLTYDEKAKKPTLNAGWINAFCKAKNGDTWVATSRGISIVDNNTYTLKSLKNNPILSSINNSNCLELWVDSKDRIWIGSRSGVYCYDQINNSLKHYTTEDGLADNVVHTINEDNYGTIYFGTDGGLSVLSKDGSIRTYNRSNGLKNDKCEGILKDEKGFLWIGNLNCILRYDPVNKTFAVFEEGYGFSHSGFRMRSCYKSNTGEMFWGSDKGLRWFYPDEMKNISTTLQPYINKLIAGKTIFSITEKTLIRFPYNTSTIVFQFSSGEITGGKKIQYQYRLIGFEKDWKSPVATAQATFNNLPAGKYSFEIKASRDGLNWYLASYPIDIIIAKPWWRQNWFRFIYLSIITISLLVLYRNFRRRKKVKEAMNKTKMELMELNMKIAESKFLNLRLQMNPHFLFNSLSSIQVLIVSQKTTEAYKYLTLFSNFLRSLLNYAEKNFMPLDEELKVLKMYIELESLRFDKSFSYDINVDETLSNDEILIPSLMVQPFVENAIWHGLLHKEGEKKLSIQFINHSDKYLTCSIEDNGVGRTQSDFIQKSKIKSIVHTSKGIAIIKERLSLLQQKTGKPAHVEVIDLYNQSSEATGTKVIITIPYYNPEES